MHKLSLTLMLAVLTSACSVLEPKLPNAQPNIAESWPEADLVETADTTMPGWKEFFIDKQLVELIDLALVNNRDLRVAALNVERARAMYRIQRADFLPSLNAVATDTRGCGDGTTFVNQGYTVAANVPAYELDLFGRIHNLTQAELRTYLAQEQAQRSLQISLVAEVANAWLTLNADQELKRIAEAALQNREQQVELTQKRFELGAVSSLDVSQAQIQLETARADVWRYAGQVAQDHNALNLLTGSPLDPALSKGRFDLAVSGIKPLPAGVPSKVLLRRPDVQQAEYTLGAANARIGAARAAFFPSITLTGSIGTASDELSGLFDSGTRTWSFVPRITLPIFQGGRLRGNLEVSKADRDIALARYEQSIQAAFRDVADALTLTHTLAEQRASRERLLAAATQADDLSQRRYAAGSDSYLVLLDAQRTLYSAQQQLVTTQLAEQGNRIALFRALGGGWDTP